MAYIDTYRAVVAPSDCDHLGHMNVSGYFQACSDAVIAFQAQLGLTPADVLKGRKLSFAVVRAGSDFKSEVTAGDVLTMHTGLVEVGTKSAIFRHRLVKSDGSVAFETLFRCVLLDLVARRAAVIPDEVRTAATSLWWPPED